MKSKNLKSKGLLIAVMLSIVLVAGCLGNSDTVKGIKNDSGDAKNWIADKFSNDEQTSNYNIYNTLESCNKTCAGNFSFFKNKTTVWCICL